MRSAKCLLFLAVALVLVSPTLAEDSSVTGAAIPDTLMALFNYDESVPLDVQVMKEEEIVGSDATLQDIHYASPPAGRVTAYVVAPQDKQAKEENEKDSKPYAGIVFLHWGQGDRSEFIWEAALYANAGAVSVLVDAPWNRPEPWTGASERLDSPVLTRDMYVQNVIDLRRAVDLLIARGDVDENRIAYVGHSFGATWGGVLAAVEKRIKTCVLMGGLPSVTDFSLKGAPKFDRYMKILEEQVPKDMLEGFVTVISSISPERFVRHAAPCSILFQFGLYDSWISKKAADIYFEAANGPKEARWYPTSHEFTDTAALADRASWLEKEVGLAPVRPILTRVTGEK